MGRTPHVVYGLAPDMSDPLLTLLLCCYAVLVHHVAQAVAYSILRLPTWPCCGCSSTTIASPTGRLVLQ